MSRASAHCHLHGWRDLSGDSHQQRSTKSSMPCATPSSSEAVSNPLPTVTIIVPARPGESRILALEAIRALDYPRERMDVIVARGKQPSVQRNTAIKSAQGDLIYFLDDDARPAPDRKSVV